MNISSAIVYIRENFAQTLEEIKKIKGCEMHLQDQDRGIAIVSIEAEEVAKEMQILELINAIPNVLEAHLHYSYSEDELDRAREELSGEISPILDDEVPAEEVRYSGSVYHQMNK